MRITRALSLLKLGHTAISLSMFKTTYEAIDFERNSDLVEISRLAPELIAAGAREEDLTAVLESDEQKAWDFLPVIISRRHPWACQLTPRRSGRSGGDLGKCIEHSEKHGVQPGNLLNFADKFASET